MKTIAQLKHNTTVVELSKNQQSNVSGQGIEFGTNGQEFGGIYVYITWGDKAFYGEAFFHADGTIDYAYQTF